MDFDFTQFDNEIKRYDAVHLQNNGEGTAMGAQELSRNMAKAIAQLLPQLSAETDKDKLSKLTHLCAKMVEFSPYLSARRILQGQFYLQIKDFKNAAVSFMEAYNIEKDVTKAWPHLQKTEVNAGLLVWMGYALYHSGEVDLGKRFFDVGQKRAAEIKQVNDANETTGQKPDDREPS